MMRPQIRLFVQLGQCSRRSLRTPVRRARHDSPIPPIRTTDEFGLSARARARFVSNGTAAGRDPVREAFDDAMGSFSGIAPKHAATSQFRRNPSAEPASTERDRGKPSQAGFKPDRPNVRPHHTTRSASDHNQDHVRDTGRDKRTARPPWIDDFEPPVLKSNPYVDKYTVSNAELRDEKPRSGVRDYGRSKNRPFTRLYHPNMDESRRGATSQRRLPPSQLRTRIYGETRGADQSQPYMNRQKGPRTSSANTPKAPFRPSNVTRPRFDLSERNTVEFHDKYISISDDGSWKHITYSRLRDSCDCEKCIDPSTRQRTHTGGEVHASLEGTVFGSDNDRVPDQDVMSVKATGNEDGPALVVKWPLLSSERKVADGIFVARDGASDGADAQSEQDGSNQKTEVDEEQYHISTYSLPRLMQIRNGGDRPTAGLEFSMKKVFWTAESIAHGDTSPPAVPVRYSDLEAESSRTSALQVLLKQVHTYGISFIEGVPTDRTANEDCRLREVMNWIGMIRNSFYGETWDVKSVQKSKNVAYTSLNLGLHMDLLYFTDPPRFQALHCLRNRVQGGLSYYVDSFHVARTLPRATQEILGKYPMHYQYNNDNHLLRCAHTVLPPDGHYNALRAAINYSPPFQADPIALPNPQIENQYYAALSEFDKALNDPKNRFERLMKEGDLVLFDNRRVLHARTAFWDYTEEERAERGLEVVKGEPTRWLKGCYLDADVVWDKLMTLGVHQQLNQ